MKKCIGLFLDMLLVGFSILILVNLILIKIYSVIASYEYCIPILISEMVMMAVVIVLAVMRLVVDFRTPK